MASAAGGSALPPEPPRVLETSAVSKLKHADGSKTLNGHRVGRFLGSGSFAKVKLCESEATGETFALKVFRKGRLRRQKEFIGNRQGGGMKVRTSLDKVYTEISAMKRLCHPNCVRLHCVFDEPDQDGKLYLVIEYAAGGASMEWDDARLLFKVPGTADALVPEAVARRFVQDALQGLGHMHGQMVAHRDVKPQNLLVDLTGHLKVGDFGTALVMGEDFVVYGTEGTYFFYAPEMCRSGYVGHDGRRSDVWALGISLWAFVYGSVPFFKKDLLKLLEHIGEADLATPRGALPPGLLSQGGSAFLDRLLATEAPERPLCGELLEDAWLRGAAAPASAAAS